MSRNVQGRRRWAVKNMAERIVTLREEAGLSQEGLANIVGVHRSQVSRWERGEGGIDDQKLARLADAFSDTLGRRITTDFVLGREEAPSQSAKKGSQGESTATRLYPVGMTQTLPVFDRVSVGAEPHLIGQEDVPMSELRDILGPPYFLEVTDDSMTGAGIARGHRALIDTGAEIHDGDIVLAQVEGDNEARLRQYYQEGDRVLLLADNSGGKPCLTDPKAVHIFGKMIWGKYYPKTPVNR